MSGSPSDSTYDKHPINVVHIFLISNSAEVSPSSAFSRRVLCFFVKSWMCEMVVELGIFALREEVERILLKEEESTSQRGLERRLTGVRLPVVYIS